MTLGFPGLFPSVAEDPAGDTPMGYFDAVLDTASASYVFGYRSLDGVLLAGASLLDAAGVVLNGLSTPTGAVTGTSTTFSVAPTDQITSVASTTWSYGDGTTASGASVTHAFASPGTYSMSVTSTDASGNSTTQSAKITVSTTLLIKAPKPKGKKKKSRK